MLFVQTFCQKQPSELSQARLRCNYVFYVCVCFVQTFARRGLFEFQKLFRLTLWFFQRTVWHKKGETLFTAM